MKISKEEPVIVVTTDSSISHTVNRVAAALKEPQQRFAINRMKRASVKRMYKDKCAIDALTALTICKRQIQKVALNVSALAKQHVANAHI